MLDLASASMCGLSHLQPQLGAAVELVIGANEQEVLLPRRVVQRMKIGR
jgi:hypothetical protein